MRGRYRRDRRGADVSATSAVLLAALLVFVFVVCTGLYIARAAA